jgi:hypothetical protein
MEIKPNYQSVVAIGGFNPAILTPDFLRNQCHFESDHEPTGLTTPVTTKLKYGNIEFIMELNRFQVKLEEIQDFADKSIVDVVLEYLRILEYTPLSMLGLNFNYLLIGMDNAALAKLFEKPLRIGAKLDLAPISLTVVARKPDGAGIAVTEATVNHLVANDIKNSIRISLESNSLTVNNNFEIGNLEGNRDRISLLESEYSGFIENNGRLIEKLERL